MPLANCEINLVLTWSKNYTISFATRETKFAIRDTKLYVPIVTLSIEYNASGSLWQCYRSDQNVIITNSELFKSKIKLTRTSLVLIIQRRFK